MKKRIFALALIIGLLSITASAWASVNYFRITRVEPVSSIPANAKTGDSVTISFDVDVSYTVQPSTETNAEILYEEETYYKNANLLKWTVGTATSFTSTLVSALKTNDPDAPVTVVDKESASTFIADQFLLIAQSVITAAGVTEGKGGTLKYTVGVTGTLGKDFEDGITISVRLYDTNSGEAMMESYTSGTTAVSGKGNTGGTTVTQAEVVIPEWPKNAYWEIIDPTFGTKGGDEKSKVKVTTSKITSFKQGTSSDALIEITGPGPLVDVYIAAKDALKLWPDDTVVKALDKKTGKIQLTKDNIEKYSIPFGVTSYDIPSSSTSKTQKNSITLRYNGAKVVLKGFPITVSALNNNMKDKPATKTIKIDIGDPKTSVPSFYYDEYTECTTNSEDVAEEMADSLGEGDYDVTKSHYEFDYGDQIMVQFTAVESTSDQSTPSPRDKADPTDDIALTGASLSKYFSIYLEEGTPRDLGTSTYTKTVTDEGTYVFTLTENGGEDSGKAYVVLSSDTKVYYANNYKKIVDECVYYGYKVAPTPKKGIELAVSLEDGKIEYETYNDLGAYLIASGDGPYTITSKPAVDDSKLADAGIRLTITQPKYNSLGEVETPGYVNISGKLDTTSTKEIKQAITFTVTNTSTKKKGTVKVTVFGKLPPTIQKVDETTHRLTTKEVVAGKLPSVKFSAKGSKIISWHLGRGEVENKVYYEDNEAEDLAYKLVSLGLSFDKKKGALTAPDKKKILPTIEDDEYVSFDLYVTAANEAGSDWAVAKIGITGAKPTVATKSVPFTTTDYKGYSQPIKANVGSAKPATASTEGTNVRYTIDADGKTALANLGLELVNWNDLNRYVSQIVSAEISLKSGDTISAAEYQMIEDEIIEVETEGDLEDMFILSDDNTYVVSGDVKLLSGDTTEYVTFADSDYEEDELSADKNVAYIQVIDTGKLSKADVAKKAATVLITAENYGAYSKAAKVTIEIKAGTTATSLPKAQAYSTAPVKDNAAEETKKTAHGTPATVNNYVPEEVKAEETEDTEEEEVEAVVTIGEARTAADLTAAQKAFLEENGYTVISTLPEISANVDGQQEFEVTLNENAPEGEKLIYLAFPKDAPADEDDEIVDFYDETGAAIEDVPASLNITVAPWLRANVTYGPVIVVEDK